MRYAKIQDDGNIEMCHCPDKDKEGLAALMNDGYLPLSLTPAPECETFYMPVDSFSIVDGMIVQQWHTAIDNNAINARINELKGELSATDYIISKCAEAVACGTPMPYDINAIHAQREAWRAEINRLERYGISD